MPQTAAYTKFFIRRAGKQCAFYKELRKVSVHNYSTDVGGPEAAHVHRGVHRSRFILHGSLRVKSVLCSWFLAITNRLIKRTELFNGSLLLSSPSSDQLSPTFKT